MNIPKESIINDWVESLTLTEVPLSYQILSCMSMVGCLLGRKVYFDDIDWRVWTNLSVMLVGPSGIGKDTIINVVIKTLQENFPDLPIGGGRTIEKLYDYLIDKCGNPAVCFVPAGELTAFLGTKDYQSGKVNELTDLLSTNPALDVSTRSRPDLIIPQPTITMIAGSTQKWLHTCMPEGSMEGGFLPRFVIISEEQPNQHKPMAKFFTAKEDIELVKIRRERFVNNLVSILKELPSNLEMFPLGDAKEVYYKWYISRFEEFSESVRDYANRARVQVIKLAMLSAICRGHSYIASEDIEFAIDIMSYVAKKIEIITIPPTKEAECVEAVRRCLPAYRNYIIKTVTRKFEKRIVNSAIDILLESGDVINEKGLLKVNK